MGGDGALSPSVMLIRRWRVGFLSKQTDKVTGFSVIGGRAVDALLKMSIDDTKSW